MNALSRRWFCVRTLLKVLFPTLFLLAIGLLFLNAPAALGATTINETDQFAYGANLGWLAWRGDTEHGAVIGDYVCSGFIYAANVGWINLGGGAPANGIRYQNDSASDFGVNHDGQGNLRGYAYGANIGWITFESTGAPKVDLRTGRLSGSIYSANCGWISLSNALAAVRTDTLSPGPMDQNALPLAWELEHFGSTGVDPQADPDRDGASNQQEYLAGTDPLNGADTLAITSISRSPEGTRTQLTWNSALARCYYIQERLGLGTAESWSDSGLGLIGPDGTTTRRTLTEPAAPGRFYRLQAVKEFFSQ